MTNLQARIPFLCEYEGCGTPSSHRTLLQCLQCWQLGRQAIGHHEELAQLSGIISGRKPQEFPKWRQQVANRKIFRAQLIGNRKKKKDTRWDSTNV